MIPKESAKVIFGVLHDDWFSWTPEVVEAFSMAISALEKQSRIITVTDAEGGLLASISDKDIIEENGVHVIISEEYMETKRAIEVLRQNAEFVDAEFEDAIAIAISALEKQIPKKPRHIDKNATFDGNWKRVCPACGRVLVERITTPEESYPRIYNHTPHCICGQAIDWEEE